MDRNELLDRLNGLLRAQFDEIVFRLAVPAQFLSNGARATVSTEILRLLEQTDRLGELEALLAGPAGGSSQFDDRRAPRSGLLPRVAVVSVTAELGEVQRVVAARLRGLSGGCDVSELDAAQPAAWGEAQRADYRLLLLGARTGGTNVMTRLHEGGADALRSLGMDPLKVVPAEIEEAQRLLAATSDTFATGDEAASRAVGLYSRWLKAWGPVAEGHGATLESWEEAYLRARLDLLEKGSFGALQARAGRRQLDRKRLYAPLFGESVRDAVRRDVDHLVRERGHDLPRRQITRYATDVAYLTIASRSCLVSLCADATPASAQRSPHPFWVRRRLPVSKPEQQTGQLF
jgi:hypothetical protein